MNDDPNLPMDEKSGELRPDQMTEIKGLLEAALLVAGEPVPLSQLSTLFDPQLEAAARRIET